MVNQTRCNFPKNLVMTLALLTIYLHLPGCSSLKQKRSRLKPLLSRIHKEFNVSAAEIGLNDHWQESVIGCALVSNENAHAHRVLQRIVGFLPENWPDLEIIEFHIENY